MRGVHCAVNLGVPVHAVNLLMYQAENTHRPSSFRDDDNWDDCADLEEDLEDDLLSDYEVDDDDDRGDN